MRVGRKWCVLQDLGFIFMLEYISYVMKYLTGNPCSDRNKLRSTEMIAPKIQKLLPGDWQTFKYLRLKSLSLHPNVFSPLIDEFSRTDEEWFKFLQNPKFQGFQLIFNEKPIGLTGIIEDRNCPKGTTGLFVMSYIEVEFRSRGFSKYFYDARIEWAKEFSSYKKLIVGHREGNESSRRANQKAGFKLFEVVDWNWPDGTMDKLYRYELII